MVLQQGDQRFLKGEFRNNSRTFQERINTFEENK